MVRERESVCVCAYVTRGVVVHASLLLRVPFSFPLTAPSALPLSLDTYSGVEWALSQVGAVDSDIEVHVCACVYMCVCVLGFLVCSLTDLLSSLMPSPSPCVSPPGPTRHADGAHPQRPPCHKGERPCAAGRGTV